MPDPIKPTQADRIARIAEALRHHFYSTPFTGDDIWEGMAIAALEADERVGEDA